MALSIFRLKGDIKFHSVDRIGEIEDDEIDVVIVSTEATAQILQEAINSGFDADVDLFDKKTGKKIY